MMEYENGKKRKVRNKHQLKAQFLSQRYLILCCCFFVLLFFLSSDRISTLSVRSDSLRPSLRVPALSVLSSMDSIHRSFHGGVKFPELRVDDRVQFPDHLLLILSSKIERGGEKNLVCVYRGVKEETLVLPSISSDEFDEFRSIVRCPNAPLNYSSSVDLRFRGDLVKKKEQRQSSRVHNWEKLGYEAVVDGDTVVVFVKGLTRRPHKESDPSYYKCQFEIGDSDEKEVTQALAAAQEVVRCVSPDSLKLNPEMMFRVSVIHIDPRGRTTPALPSVARLYGSDLNEKNKKEEKSVVNNKHELCVCTMLWNQAPFLREWIMYHSWLGVERWFIYDNNSDDGIQDEIELLSLENYNVSRHVWPWIKTQEAGFSHCAVRAKEECNWVGFFDVDEFYYFPTHRSQGLPSKNALKSLVSNYTSWDLVGEIRTECHSYGPSGLTSVPSQGVTVGYTCRQANPERHKSIIRPELLTSSLLNEVHHFQLKEGIGHMSLVESVAVVNHYKYQVWETFKAKFYRRVATYVVDWQENQNQGSKDRAPGLGTEAIEPPDWKRRFCEVWDTGLKDLVLSNFADQVTGYLPWQRQQQQE
ncbi:PREDICTED: glycosyltransferase family 92 protein At1g27200 [Camelina sativa]|uniref:Glycosyltransferase family 92 protein n=1 Tax=Camelina sativa TaxID=90675 RepID=A0ABM0YCJ0_CAMSA|nr:PREDICTED: glycosyltransferase family 92 protein At1g27200 [Camelina sativa]